MIPRLKRISAALLAAMLLFTLLSGAALADGEAPAGEPAVTEGEVSPGPEVTADPAQTPDVQPKDQATPVPEDTAVPAPEATAAPGPGSTAVSLPENTATPVPEATAAPVPENLVEPVSAGEDYPIASAVNLDEHLEDLLNMINALPKSITRENSKAVQAQIDAINEMVGASDPETVIERINEILGLSFASRYENACRNLERLKEMYPPPFVGAEGVGIESDPYLIYNETQLKEFCNFINTDTTGRYPGGRDSFYKLAADIVLKDEEWTPIGSDVLPFCGTFDGGGHTITFHFSVSDDTVMGLFGANNGTVKNLNISDGSSIAVNASLRHGVGMIAGENYGTIENCRNGGTISDNVSGSHSSYAFGGIAGVNAETITNCCNTGSISVKSSGGIAGLNTSNSNITNCYNTGNISGASSGGIVGDNDGTITNCYNTGSISGGSSGGIAGDNASTATVTNCYHLDTCGAAGGGMAKTAEAFASGEVAWLLQNGQETQVWGQQLGTDQGPVLTGAAEKAVCKVTFATKENESYAVKYANPTGLTALPDPPTVSGRTFDRWISDLSTGEEFSANAPVNGDMTVYAAEKERFGGETDTIERTVTYGEGLREDLSGHIQYRSGIPSAGKFTYTIQSGNDALHAAVDGDELIVPTDANAGSYTLTVEAKEIQPQYSLASVGSYGTDPVTLTVQVTIEKVPSSGAVTGKTGLVYAGAAQALVEVTEPAVGGELRYSTEQAGEYSADIPTGTDADIYTVWYKVAGDENHTDTAPQMLEVTIAKAAGTGAVTMADCTCKEDAAPAANSDTNGTEHVTYSYKARNADDSTYSAERPLIAGNYTVRAVFASTKNYNGVTATADFKITHQFNAGWEQQADGCYHLCACGTGLLLEVDPFTQVPEGLKKFPDLDTVEEITRVLTEQLDTGEDHAVYDVRLETQVGGKWVEATPDNFPAEGVTITVPYPAGTDASYAFTVIHMITTGADAGRTETLSVTKGAGGLTFTVKSLSPIAIGWTAPTVPAAAASAAATAPDTGDAARPGLWLAVAALSLAGLGLIKKRRLSGRD